MVWSRYCAGACLLLVTVCLPSPCTWADQLTLQLDRSFSGHCPSGEPPWLVAEFTDRNGYVELKLSIHLQGSREFLRGSARNPAWCFNFDPDTDVTSLRLAPADPRRRDRVFLGQNAFKADGDGKYDLGIVFRPRLAGPGVVTFHITSSSGSVSASSFDCFSEAGGGKGIYRSAAHVQGIGRYGCGSGWIDDSPGPAPPLPLPSALGCILGGLVALALGSRHLAHTPGYIPPCRPSA